MSEPKGRPYVGVMTVDMRGSRRMQTKRRAKVQRMVMDLLNHLNRAYSRDLVARFEFSGGDEFQGVIKGESLPLVWDIFRLIKKTLGIGLYFGVGVGSISTPQRVVHLLRVRTYEMDGESFHRSRDALITAKHGKRDFVIRSPDAAVDQELNTIIRLMLLVSNGWTARQREIISYFEAKERDTQIEAARAFKVTKQAVSKALSKSGWETYSEAEELIRTILVAIGRGKSPEVYLRESTRGR